MLPIILGAGLALTFGGIGGFLGVILGHWLQSHLSPQEQEDLKKVLDLVINDYGLNESKDITRLPESQQEEIEEAIRRQLQLLWGTERLQEVEGGVEKHLEDEGVEVNDNFLASI